MCGRYVSAMDRAALLEQFHASAVDDEQLRADYNVAPSKKVYAVLDRLQDEGPARRELKIVRWGLIPSWAKDPKIGNRLVNARIETAAQKPSFRAAYARRRCVLPADGYYEWYSPEAAPGATSRSAGKQPFYIHPADGSTMALAGLYEIWREPADRPLDHADPGTLRWTCTILTTTATDDLGRIHDRAPLLVSSAALDGWLDPELREPPSNSLVPAAPGLLTAFPVSTAVINVPNNEPDLIKPVTAAD